MVLEYPFQSVLDALIKARQAPPASAYAANALSTGLNAYNQEKISREQQTLNNAKITAELLKEMIAKGQTPMQNIPGRTNPGDLSGINTGMPSSQPPTQVPYNMGDLSKSITETGNLPQDMTSQAAPAKQQALNYIWSHETNQMLDPITKKPLSSLDNTHDYQKVGEIGMPNNGTTGDVSIDTATKGDLDLAKRVVMGESSLSSGVGFRDRTRINELASQLAERMQVPYSDSLGTARANTRNEFLKGNASRNVRSLNTAIGHLDTLKNSVDSLDPGKIPWLNSVAISGQTQMGDPRITKVNQAINAVSGELSTLFKGTSGTDSEITAWKNSLNQNMSKKQWDSSINTLVDLLGSRMNALQGQWDNAFQGTNVPLELLTPKSKKVLNKFGVNTDTNNQQTNTQQVQPNTQQIIQKSPSTGKTRISNDGGKTWTIQP